VQEKMTKMMAPAGTSPESVGVEGGVFEVRDRIAEVDARAVADLESAGWMVIREPMPEPEFQRLQARRDFLSARRDDLLAQLAEADATLAALSGDDDLMAAALVEGDADATDAAELHSKIETARSAATKIQAALDQLDGETLQLSREIAKQQEIRDRPAQVAAAAPLHVEAEEALAVAVEMLASITAILGRRKALADRVAREFPLADPLPPVALWNADDSLEARTRAVWDARGASLADIGERALSRWILITLGGPRSLPPGPAGGSEETMRRNHMREQA